MSLDGTGATRPSQTASVWMAVRVPGESLFRELRGSTQLPCRPGALRHNGAHELGARRSHRSLRDPGRLAKAEWARCIARAIRG